MNKKYSNFKAMFAIARASLLSIIRNPSSVVFSLIFPLIFIVVFGFIGGGKMAFDVAISKNSDRNNPIYQKLIQVGNFRIIDGEEDNVINTNLEKGNIDAILDIKKNPEGKFPVYEVEIKTNKATPEKSNLCKLILVHVIDKINTKQLTQETQVVEIKETEVQGRLFKTIDFILPGQLGFSILSAGVFGTSFILILLRETLVIKRFFATPINRKFIIIGEALARLIFAMTGSIIIILVGHFFFGFTLVNGVVTVLNMLIVSALGLLVFLGFGFLVSNIAKSINAVPPIANLITLPQFLLAGTFFSIDNFPSWLQPISRALPLTYLNDALRKIAFDGATILTLPKEMLILAAWGVVVYAFAIKFFKWE
jgi:ABC-2 type transport system permease protein